MLCRVTETLSPYECSVIISPILYSRAEHPHFITDQAVELGLRVGTRSVVWIPFGTNRVRWRGTVGASCYGHFSAMANVLHKVTTCFLPPHCSGRYSSEKWQLCTWYSKKGGELFNGRWATQYLRVRYTEAQLEKRATPAYRYVLVQEYLTRMVSQHRNVDDLQPVDHVLYCKNIDPFKCMRVPVSRVKEALKLALTGAAEIWLLLRSGIIQSVSCTAAISWSIVLPIWVLMARDSSISALWLQHWHLVANQRDGEKCP
jgi:hypothetical protein